MMSPGVVLFDQQVEERRQRLLASASRGGIPLVDPRGHPVPPAEVVKRLPPGASIKWIPAGGFYGTQYFALFTAWEPNDPRWQHVQSGAYPREDARDMVQMFPPECSPQEMAAYVEARWGRRHTADPGADADRIVTEMAVQQEKAQADAVEGALRRADEHSVRESRHDLRVRAGVDTPTPMVTVAGEPSRITAGVDDGPKRLLSRG